MTRSYFYLLLSLFAGLTSGFLAGCALDTTNLLPNQTVGEVNEEGTSQQEVNFQPVMLGTEANIDEVEIIIVESEPPQFNAIVHGSLPDSCVTIERLDHSRLIDTFWVNVITARQLETDCTTSETTFGEGFQLNIVGLPTGNYTLTAVSLNAVDGSFFLSPDFVIAGESTPAVAETQPQPASTANTSSIIGQLWVDQCRLLTDGTPTEGCVLDDEGAYQPDRLADDTEARLVGVLINLHRGDCPGKEILQTKATNVNGVYEFDSLATGFYCVSIDGGSGANAIILGTGGWSYPLTEENSTNTFSSVTVSPSETQSANFGWQVENETVVVADTPPEPIDDTNRDATQADCLNAAAYVADTSIPDDTVIIAGEPFTKTWQIRNDGDCSWGPGYTLVFDDGDLLSGPDSVPFQVVIPPDREVAISVPLLAPLESGTYRSNWKIRSPDGTTFGSRGDFAFYVQIVVADEP